MRSAEELDKIAHRMRAVLTYLRGYASMLPLDGPLTPEQEHYAAKILKEVEELAALVRAMASEDAGAPSAGAALELLALLEREALAWTEDAERPGELPADVQNALALLRDVFSPSDGPRRP